MQCLTPYTIYRAKGNTSRIGKEFAFSDVVPCGKCPACLRTRRSNWSFRLQQEQKRSYSAAFLTLTYDPHNLPLSPTGLPTLKVKDHQNFIKRLRKQIHENFQEEIQAPIKYYSCGEYGETYHRPHFHSIIFNLPDSYIRHPELITKDWKNGQTRLDVCNPKTIAYVTGYINKTMYTEKLKDDRIPEFSLMSKGLGENYITPNKKAYYQNILTPYLIIENGDKIQMPRYYKNKIFTKGQQQILSEKTKAHQLENPLFHNEKHRHDLVSDQISKHQKSNLLNRKKL